MRERGSNIIIAIISINCITTINSLGLLFFFSSWEILDVDDDSQGLNVQNRTSQVTETCSGNASSSAASLSYRNDEYERLNLLENEGMWVIRSIQVLQCPMHSMGIKRTYD
jgi:hypothetical protein